MTIGSRVEQRYKKKTFLVTDKLEVAGAELYGYNFHRSHATAQLGNIRATFRWLKGAAAHRVVREKV